MTGNGDSYPDTSLGETVWVLPSGDGADVGAGRPKCTPEQLAVLSSEFTDAWGRLERPGLNAAREAQTADSPCLIGDDKNETFSQFFNRYMT